MRGAAGVVRVAPVAAMRHSRGMVPDPARNRWLAITLARLVGAAGAVLGVVLLAMGDTTGRKVLGIAIVVAALWVMAIVPRALARRWRTPPR